MTESLPEFVLLTGALGSGKTTLLSDYLACRDTADVGVIINDAGEVNVDGAVVSADSRNLSMATLGNGCICCSMGNGVQEGIDALLLARAERQLGPLRKIILETSGLAEPGPILRSLRNIRQLDFKVRVVATYDGGPSNKTDSFLPHYAEQLAAAQVIVITKLDMLSPKEWPGRVALAKAFSPLGRAIVENDRLERAHAAFDHETAAVSNAVSIFHATEAAHHRIRTALARWERQATWGEISEWIENVSGYFGSRLLRVKGLIQPSGFESPILVNGVAGIFSPSRSVNVGHDNDLGLVMIFRDVSPNELSNLSEKNPKLELRFK